LVQRILPQRVTNQSLISKTGGYQGVLEYIPGECAHRPVAAEGYMFIHCIFVGFKAQFKGKGYASSMIDICIKEAKEQGRYGVAVVTRKGPFMAKKDIFIKKGFHVVDSAKPDFELLALKFKPDTANPKFAIPTTSAYTDGLTVIRSPQCHYSVKNVDVILVAAKEMGLNTNIVDLKDAATAQHSPCAFGTFCIINNGEILSQHPISNTRFENIMNKPKR
jgi:hypothetical protein